MLAIWIWRFMRRPALRHTFFICLHRNSADSSKGRWSCPGKDYGERQAGNQGQVFEKYCNFRQGYFLHSSGRQKAHKTSYAPYWEIRCLPQGRLEVFKGLEKTSSLDQGNSPSSVSTRVTGKVNSLRLSWRTYWTPAFLTPNAKDSFWLALPFLGCADW